MWSTAANNAFKSVNDYLGEITDFIDLNPSAYRNAFCERICKEAETNLNTYLVKCDRILSNYRKEIVVSKLKKFYGVQ